LYNSKDAAFRGKRRKQGGERGGIQYAKTFPLALFQMRIVGEKKKKEKKAYCCLWPSLLHHCPVT